MVSLGTRLRLVDAHSGAVFEGAYRNARGPIPQAMDQLCLFLRDRRSGGLTNIDVGVIDFLTGVMAAVGQKSAVVLSAYRSLQTNALLAQTMFGVADNSQHLYGRALDVSFPGIQIAAAAAAARAMRHGGVGWYPHSHFIHLDTGPVRNWDLGGEGLQELLRQPPAKPDAEAPVEAPPQLTVGGVKETLLLPGRPVPAGSGRVAGLLLPARGAP